MTTGKGTLHVIINADVIAPEPFYSTEEDIMKGKCIFRVIIVVTLAFLSLAAFVYSEPEIMPNKIPKYKMISKTEGTNEPEQNRSEGFLSALKTGMNAYDIMKVLAFLCGMGNIIFRQTRSENMLKIFVGTVYALTVTITLGKWGIYRACEERGYEAVGGEYCLIFIVSWVAESAITQLFDTLEELKYERVSREEGN